MKLSQVLDISTELDIINEQDFDSLGLLESKYSGKMLSFIDSEQFMHKIPANVTMLMVTNDLFKKMSKKDCGFYICENPRLAFFKVHNELANREGYHRDTFETIVGKNCNISALSYVEKKNVIIGDNVIIEEFVSIKENVTIGNNVIIRAGTVIGSPGFEFKKDGETLLSIKHLGGVKIGDNVEIKCNNVVDKAVYPWDETVIGEYTKIDNLVHFGHACKIGKRVMIPANSVIGGRVVVEDDAWIGIGSAIRNGIHIGANARCNMGSVVTKDVKENESVTGNFAIEHSKFIEKLKESNKGEK